MSNIDLWKHQQDAVALLKTRPRFGIFHDIGTGKTRTNIAAYLEACDEAGGVLPCLILCPLICVEAWRRHFVQLAPQRIQECVQVLSGTHVQRLKQLENRKKGKKIFITNLDIINSKAWPKLASLPFHYLIVDESHKFKNHDAKRTQRLILLADRVKAIRILTGTPILNMETDLWSQVRLLSPLIWGKNFYSWRAKYFEDKNAGMPRHIYFPDWQIRRGSKEAFTSTLKEWVHIVDKKDVLELPEMVRTSVYAQVLPEQAKHYNEMERHFITYIQDEACEARVALTKLLRLQQILVGALVTDNGVQRIASGKLLALEELLDDLSGNKVVIWTNFVPTYDDIIMLCNRKGLHWVKLTGQENAAQKAEAVATFRDDPNCVVCIANQQAAGTGTDGLQVAKYAIYYSKGFNYGDDRQSQDRIYRGGSEIHDKVTRIDIIVPGTVDEDVSDALERKEELSQLLANIRARGVSYGKHH